MSSRVLVGLFEAAEDPTPPQDAGKGKPGKAPRKLGFRRLLKLVLVAVVIAGVGIGVWVFQPIPMVMATFRSVAREAPAALGKIGVTTADQSQGDASTPADGASAATSTAESPTDTIPDVHPSSLTPNPKRVRTSSRSAASGGASKVAAPAEAASGSATASTLPESQAAVAVAGTRDEIAAGATTAGQVTVPQAPATVAGAPPPVQPAVPPAWSRIAPAATLTPLYSSADADVAPPRPIIQQKLGGIVGAIEPGTAVTIEFVVNEQGEVESAKGKSVPRSLGESLLLATGLHALKSWRFEPAQKNGQPVRYRNSISFGAY